MFVVRNRLAPEKFASKAGWASFSTATIFTFKDDAPALITDFMVQMENGQELVELKFAEVRALN